MLSPVRSFAGLCQPPNQFTTERNESVNNVLKSALSRQKQDMLSVIKTLNDDVNMQNEDITRAIYGVGEYRLAPKYAHLAVDPVEWCRMNHAQREAHVKRRASLVRLLDAFKPAMNQSTTLANLVVLSTNNSRATRSHSPKEYCFGGGLVDCKKMPSLCEFHPTACVSSPTKNQSWWMSP
jgi:hypothetical protein